MAAITSLESSRMLTSMVQRWDRRWRAGLTLIWLPRALAPALVVGLVLAVISRIRPFLLPDQIALIIFIGMAAGTLVMAASIWLRERSILHAARRFDVILGLNERISTALELIGGRIATTDELAQLQLQDAQERARAAHPGKRLPLHLNGREWAGLALLIIAVAILLLLPNPQDTITQDNVAATAAIEEAASTLRQITEQVASDSTLREEERRELLEVMETASNTLSRNDVSAEEAFAAVTDAQNSLESLVEMFDQQLNTSNAAAQAAANALQSASQTPQNADNAYEQLAQALEQLAQASASMNSEQQQQMMEQLQQAASQMTGSGNSGLQQAAEQMQQAVNQMQSGNNAAAAGTMQQAAQSAQQGGQTANQTSQSAQNASQQAQNASSAAQNIARSQSPQSANASQQQNSAQGGQQEDSQAQEMSGSGESQPQQSSQSGQQSGEQSNQSGSGSGQQGQMGSQPGAESGQLGSGESNQGQESANGSAQGQNEGQLSAAAVSESGAGAGDEQAAGPSSSSSSQMSAETQSNNADGEGERGSDEMIFAPRRIGGSSGEDEIFLQSDDPNAPVLQGEFAQNPTGSSTVPYSSVFSDYANAASQALESGYVPLGLRDLIRSYFSSLEPSSSGGN